MKWIYKDNFFDGELRYNYHGFIYKLEYRDEDGQIYTYYGKKNFVTTKNQLARQDEKPRTHHYRFFGKNKNGKRVRMEETRFESDWMTYNGSCKYVPEGLIMVSKEIVKLCDNPIDTPYWETYYLMVKNVLFDEYNLNMAIGKPYHAGRISGSKENKKKDK